MAMLIPHPPLVASAALAAALLSCGCSGPAPLPLTPLGQAPSAGRAGVQMTLPLLKGGEVSLQGWPGKPVLITLFTTWCLRCQVEAPLFNRLHAAYAHRLRVLGVVVDVKTPPAIMQTYVEFVKFRFDVAVARPDDLELVGALGKTRRVPRTVLLDQSGIIVLDHVGQTNAPELKKQLGRLLGDAPASSPASRPVAL
jgi:thiol-disulfide isomerase/thioredoxin